MLRFDLQDFKLCYDAKFGRKKVVENGEAADKAVANGSSLGIASNGKRASDMAVYEQFPSQVLCLGHPSFSVNCLFC